MERGRGDPLLFIHGSLGDYRSWGAQLPPFGERYRAVAYSRRAHWPGGQASQPASCTIARHVSDLAAVIEALGLAPAHLVGSSYGALTALAFAVERPGSVRSLVLGQRPLLPWLAWRPGGQALLDAFVTTDFAPAGRAFARGDAEAGVRRFLDGVLGAGAFDRLPPEARAAMVANAAEMRAETTTPPGQYFPALSDEEVSHLRMPTLLVEGELSPAMFGRITDELARALPDAERVTIAGASHGMNAQDPPAYNAAVLAFLAGH